MEVILTILFFPILAFIYLIPAVIALIRWHHNKLAIIALNIFLGWSFIGWVAALVWSLTAKRRD